MTLLNRKALFSLLVAVGLVASANALKTFTVYQTSQAATFDGTSIGPRAEDGFIYQNTYPAAGFHNAAPYTYSQNGFTYQATTGGDCFKVSKKAYGFPCTPADKTVTLTVTSIKQPTWFGIGAFSSQAVAGLKFGAVADNIYVTVYTNIAGVETALPTRSYVSSATVGLSLGYTTRYPITKVVITHDDPTLFLMGYQVFMGTTSSLVFDDPHFVGMQGERYDVQGESDTWFNILSDTDTVINAFFHEWAAVAGSIERSTNMRDIGIVLGGGEHHIFANMSGYYIDGVSWAADSNMVLRNKDGSTLAEVEKVEQTETGPMVSIFTDAYSMSLTHRVIHGKSFYNIGLHLEDQKRDPHGLLGQTAHHQHAKHGMKVGEGEQGEGELEGTFKDYEVSSAFATDFKFTRIL